MAMRGLASATISFGLVSIPVKLFIPYESSTSVRFNQINKEDGSRIRQQLVSAKTGTIVPYTRTTARARISAPSYERRTGGDCASDDLARLYLPSLMAFVYGYGQSTSRLNPVAPHHCSIG
jgi:Ku70/Ku80-like protein